MAPIKVINIDDEKHALDTFNHIVLNHCSGVEIVKSYSSPKAFLEEYSPESIDIDILFLDVEMHPINGIDLLEELRKKHEQLIFDVVFLTAYDNFALDAFKQNAIDYILKPLMPEELIGAIEKWQNKQHKSIDPMQIEVLKQVFEQSQPAKDMMAIPTFEGYEIIEIDQIIRCEAERNYCKIYYKDKPDAYLVSRNLKELSTILEQKGFLRIHHSHLINPMSIRRILKSEGGTIEMVDGTKIRITRNKEIVLESLFNKIPKI
jgi:two-component system LytT family response regulator